MEIISEKILNSKSIYVVTFHSDNRYTDDVHWKGGSVVASQMLSWSAIMFAWNARPPHPKYFAGSDWKKTWKERLENASKPWTKKWLEHQTYDEYWVGISFG